MSYHSRRTNHLVAARPGGLSDEDSDSDDNFTVSGTSTSRKAKWQPVTTNGTTSVNGHSGGGDRENEENWEPEPSRSTDPKRPQSSKENEWGRSPTEAVRLACLRGNLEKLKDLLSPSGEYKNENARTNRINEFFMGSKDNPLILAASHGHSEIVEYLLEEEKANPNLRHPEQKITALIAMVGCDLVLDNEEAVLKGVTALVTAGADLNLQDRYGLSALMIAVKRRRSLIAKFLLEKGADPNLQDPDDQTALIVAAVDGEGRLCRLLLEHNADVHMVNRHGFTAADLAQDKDHYELANLLYIAKDTKWKPGLNPNLMKELDEEAPQRNNNPFDNYAMKEDACIDLLLSAVDGAKYLSNFRKHKISYVQFLRLDEEQLKEIGVDEVGVRESILEKIKQIQNAEWRSSSIRMIATNKNVTAGEAICMIVNTNEHLDHISSSLKYLHDRISKKPLALRHDIERNKIMDMMKFSEEMEARSCRVRNDAVELYKLLAQLQGYTELQISGKLPKRSFGEFREDSQDSTFSTVVVGLGVTVGVGMLLFGKFKGFWSWRN